MQGTALHVGKDLIPIQGELDEEEVKRVLKQKAL
jgi:hypothetical protein